MAAPDPALVADALESLASEAASFDPATSLDAYLDAVASAAASLPSLPLMGDFREVHQEAVAELRSRRSRAALDVLDAVLCPHVWRGEVERRVSAPWT